MAIKQLEDDFDESKMFAPGAANEAVFHPSVENPNPNPLMKYYRTPGLHVKLPTNGVFMPSGGIEFTMAGDVPVFPMRASDELLLRSPDALMSGYALEQLFLSCVPAIKNPRLISSPDLDVLLLAIKAASTGPKMPVDVNCPKCNHQNSFEIHLGGILNTMKPVPSEITARINDELIAYCRPHNLANVTTLSLLAYEEMRKMQALDASNVSQDERVKAMTESYAKMSKANLAVFADCVMNIVTPEGIVRDQKQIRDFIFNISKTEMQKIEDAIVEANKGGIDRDIEVTCSNCSHEWKATVDFNPTSFFG